MMILRRRRHFAMPCCMPMGHQSDPALAILRERYAWGELSHEEFERTRKDLGG